MIFDSKFYRYDGPNKVYIYKFQHYRGYVSKLDLIDCLESNKH